MGLNWQQFELGVLRPTLQRLEETTWIPCPEAAVKLVGETLWHESDGLKALGQYPRDPDGVFGPGLGISSFERPTWNWLFPLYKWIAEALGHSREVLYEELAWNLALNVIACRLRYFVSPEALPAGDLSQTAREMRGWYWFRIYNGSGVEERVKKFVKDAKQIPWVK